ncbi:MAG TPA: hypothetical protein EYQ75_13895 [Planctomycetaceae bacterium]|nr:hypothetical protein [Planctomycetaceae bacterium]
MTIARSNRNQRRLVRGVFLFGCVLPTLVTLIATTVAHSRRSASEALEEWKSTIEFQLGVNVDVKSMQPATLGVLLNEVTLRHPETGATIAEIRQIYLARAAKRGWIVECRYPTIESEHFPHLWNMLTDHFTNRRGSVDWTGTFAATNITWNDGEQLHTLPQLQCAMRHDRSSSRCILTYSHEEQDATQPARLTMVRSRPMQTSSKDGMPTTSYEWTTSHPLPLHWLSSWMPELKRLGKEASFAGTMNVKVVEGEGSSGELIGSIRQVDLAELVSRAFPHHVVYGSCDVEFSRLLWQNNRMTAVDGKLTSRNGLVGRSQAEAASIDGRPKSRYGLVGRSLLEAASHVGLEIPAGVFKLPTYRFTKISLEFHGLDDSLRFGDENDVVVVGGDENDTRLLVASGRGSDTAAFLRWLVPDTQHQVPATDQIGALTSFLQLPAVQPQGTELHVPAVRLGSPESSDGTPLVPPSPSHGGTDREESN